MKEYRIVCDRVTKAPDGKVYVRQQQYPLNKHGGTFTSVFTWYEEAFRALEKLRADGEIYEKNCIAQAKINPKLISIVTQTNYRIETREVSEWSL